MGNKAQGYIMFCAETSTDSGITFGKEYRCVDLTDTDVVLTNDMLQCVIVNKSKLSLEPVKTQDQSKYKFEIGQVIELRSMFDKSAKYNHVCGRVRVVDRFISKGKTLYKIVTETYGSAVKITVTEQQIVSIIRDKSAEVWRHNAIASRYYDGYRYMGDYSEATALLKSGELIKDGLIKSAMIREHRDKFGKIVINSDKISLWIKNPFVIE